MTDYNHIEREARALRAIELNRLLGNLGANIRAKINGIIEVLGAFRRTPGVRA